jgi:DNA polymerase III epsilon subunit-like protein
MKSFIINFDHPLVVFDTETGGLQSYDQVDFNFLGSGLPEFYSVGQELTGRVVKPMTPILEIGAIKYDPKTFEEISTFHSYLGKEEHQTFDEYLNSCDKKALEINKLSTKIDLLASAKPGSLVITEFIEWAKGNHGQFIPAGQNVKFDIDMLQGWAKKFGISSALDYRTIGYPEDLRYYSRFYFSLPQTPTIPNYKLSTIASALGLNTDNAHEALPDVRMTAECLKIIYKRLAEKS